MSAATAKVVAPSASEATRKAEIKKLEREGRSPRSDRPITLSSPFPGSTFRTGLDALFSIKGAMQEAAEPLNGPRVEFRFLWPIVESHFLCCRSVPQILAFIKDATLFRGPEFKILLKAAKRAVRLRQVVKKFGELTSRYEDGGEIEPEFIESVHSMERWICETDHRELANVIPLTNDELELLRSSPKALRAAGWYKARIEKVARGIRRKRQAAQKRLNAGKSPPVDPDKLRTYRIRGGASCNPSPGRFPPFEHSAVLRTGSAFDWAWIVDHEPRVIPMSPDVAQDGRRKFVPSAWPIGFIDPWAGRSGRTYKDMTTFASMRFVRRKGIKHAGAERLQKIYPGRALTDETRYLRDVDDVLRRLLLAERDPSH